MQYVDDHHSPLSLWDTYTVLCGATQPEGIVHKWSVVDTRAKLVRRCHYTYVPFTITLYRERFQHFLKTIKPSKYQKHFSKCHKTCTIIFQMWKLASLAQ